jgi:hypothetical protein
MAVGAVAAVFAAEERLSDVTQEQMVGSIEHQTRGITHGMRPLGDRRRRIRLEVVGSLWGTLEVDRQAHLMNISRTGALIVSPVPAAIDSTQSLKLTIEGHEVKVSARVRHLQRVQDPTSYSPQYRIGLEFLEAPDVLVQALE